MSTQYQKRKAKISKEPESNEAVVVPVVSATPEYVALDIFSPDGGSTFQVAEIVYNPATKEAKVKEVFDISRMVGLSYKSQKNALNTLKKVKRS